MAHEPIAEGSVVPMTRWNDDRLDDLARQVRANTDQLAMFADMRTEIGHVREDTHDCINELRQLKLDLEKREKAQHDERRSDRRWMLGTFLTTAGLVIAALAIFIG